MTPVPPELVDCVFGKLDKALDRITLSTCTRVCQTWHRLALPHLFSAITIQYSASSERRDSPFVPKSIHGLHLLLEKYPFLGPCVQKVDVRVKSTALGDEGLIQWDEPASVSVFHAMTNLRHININGSHFFVWGTMPISVRQAMYNSFRLPSVTCLTLEAMHIADSNFTEFFSVIGDCVALETLDISFVDFPSRPDLTQRRRATTRSHRPQLRSLSMIVFPMVMAVLLEFLLDHADLRKLESLRLKSSKLDSSTLHTVFDQTIDKLDYLDIGFIDFSEGLEDMDLSRKLRSVALALSLPAERQCVSQLEALETLFAQTLNSGDRRIEEITLKFYSSRHDLMDFNNTLWCSLAEALRTAAIGLAATLKKVNLIFVIWSSQIPEEFIQAANTCFQYLHERQLLHVNCLA
ncbi:hypothetical protein EDD18DRAFT_1348210 [Armillaria luteobubalina]|uniref:F-box domain-containing protein n=1 Tax=Armillaria luteobubalina TaxID=153913 RepID=A0AA39QE56_9AGAR|nr:hypothetical protein EDD18DRAFT_1348210 [Armillaria luteobubalina]